MIRKIKLKNFKSHVSTEVEFDKITTIIGSGGSGKTNIFRALRIVLQNEDWPLNHIRYGKKEASITVEMDECTIERTRTKTGTSITIKWPDGTEKVYSGKKEVADIVADATGFRKHILDKEEGEEDLNFVSVYDGLYLIKSKPSDVHRKIAGLLGSNKLENALVKLNSSVRVAQLSAASTLSTLTPLRAKLTNLNELIDNIQKIRDKVSYIEQRLCEISEIEKKLHVLSYNNNVVSKGRDLLREMIEKAKMIIEMDKTLELLHRVSRLSWVPSLFSRAKGVLSKVDKFELLGNGIQRAGALIELIDCVLEVLPEKKKLCNERLTDLSDRLTLTSLGDGRCPLCRSPI